MIRSREIREKGRERERDGVKTAVRIPLGTLPTLTMLCAGKKKRGKGMLGSPLQSTADPFSTIENPGKETM